jgi:hypothetical protein
MAYLGWVGDMSETTNVQTFLFAFLFLSNSFRFSHILPKSESFLRMCMEADYTQLAIKALQTRDSNVYLWAFFSFSILSSAADMGWG